MNTNTNQSAQASNKGSEIFLQLADTIKALNGDKKQQIRSTKKLDKYAISDLECLVEYYLVLMDEISNKYEQKYGEDWQDKIEDSNLEKRYWTLEQIDKSRFDDLTNCRFNLIAYLEERNTREESEQRAKIEAKLRKKELEQKILDDLKNEGLTDVTEYQKIHWTEFSSPCKKNPQSAMVLNPDGLIDRQTATKECLKGQSKGVLKNLEVTYDKDYVVAWLRVKVISNLQELPLETIQELVKEAYDKSND